MSVMILSPLPAGMTSATELRLYGTKARDTAPDTVPATQASDGTWQADTGALEGRYWATVAGLDANGAAITADLPGFYDLPDDPTLVVSPESIATRAKIPLPISDDVRQIITDAILDAQADVVAYLGRPILPTQYVEKGCFPYLDGWELTLAPDEDVRQVVSSVAETYPDGSLSGRYTVTYIAGLDAKHDAELRPIARYVAAHALNSPEFYRMWVEVTQAKGIIRSVSAEGQSMSWEAPTLAGTEGQNRGRQSAAPGMTPGSLPTIASLDRWRLAGRRVYQGRTRGGAGWPYDYDPVWAGVEGRRWYE